MFCGRIRTQPKYFEDYYQKFEHFSNAFRDSSAGVPKLYLTRYPISISVDEHVPMKFLVTKRLSK